MKVFKALLVLALSAAAYGQTPVAMTATVTGANNAPYAYGTYQVQLVDSSSNALPSATISGRLFSQVQQTGVLSSVGALAVTLMPNSAFTQAGTKWAFTICSAKPTTLVITVPACFSLPVTITNAGSLSATLSAAAPAVYFANLSTGDSYLGALTAGALNANLPGGAKGSAPYQSAADTTAFIAGPTTSGHTFVYAWQPSGALVNPAALDLATYLASGLVSTPGIMSAGTKFVVTSGCTNSATAGGAMAGSWTASSNTCSPVITPGVTATTGFACSAIDMTTAAGAMRESAYSTTTVTFTGTNLGSTDQFVFSCTAF